MTWTATSRFILNFLVFLFLDTVSIKLFWFLLRSQFNLNIVKSLLDIIRFLDIYKIYNIIYKKNCKSDISKFNIMHILQISGN